MGQFDWELAHNRAHSRGGRLTLGNTFVAHSSCNRSQGTLTVKQTRRAIGLTTEEDDVKKRLRSLTVPQLRYLKSKHGVKVRGSVSEGFFETTRTAPSKAKLVNALSRVVGKKDVVAAESFRPQPKKKRHRSSSSWW